MPSIQSLGNLMQPSQSEQDIARGCFEGIEGRIHNLERHNRGWKKTIPLMRGQFRTRLREGLEALRVLNETLESYDRRITAMENDINEIHRALNYLIKQQPHNGVYYDEVGLLLPLVCRYGARVLTEILG